MSEPINPVQPQPNHYGIEKPANSLFADVASGTYARAFAALDGMRAKYPNYPDHYLLLKLLCENLPVEETNILDPHFSKTDRRAYEISRRATMYREGAITSEEFVTYVASQEWY